MAVHGGEQSGDVQLSCQRGSSYILWKLLFLICGQANSNKKRTKKHFCLAEADGIGRSFEKATLLSFAHLEPTFYGECCLKNRLNLIHVCHTNPRYSPLIIHFFTGYNPVNITLTYQRGRKKKYSWVVNIFQSDSTINSIKILVQSEPYILTYCRKHLELRRSNRSRNSWSVSYS